MARDTAALLDRVRKLLALAGSPNVHEAAAAASRAQALIEQHRLQGLLDAEAAAEDPLDPITDGSEAPLERGRRLRRWKGALASGLAQVNGCVAYTAARGKQQELRVAGRASDREGVRELWAWLVKRIEWCSATEGAGRDRAWHEAFRVGASEEVVARLAGSGEEALAALETSALARVEPALAARNKAVQSFVERRLRLGRGRGLRVDAEAYALGKEAGARLPLPGED